jgi:hypothetical protein
MLDKLVIAVVKIAAIPKMLEIGLVPIGASDFVGCSDEVRHI